jgi:hypothetical protein
MSATRAQLVLRAERSTGPGTGSWNLACRNRRRRRIVRPSLRKSGVEVGGRTP